MTDEVLNSTEEGIRRYDYNQDELLALVAEVRWSRLRKRIDEDWLAAIRWNVRGATDDVLSDFRPQTTHLRDTRALLAHIDLQDNVIHDLMSEDAAAKLVEQGRAEERARFAEALQGVLEGVDAGVVIVNLLTNTQRLDLSPPAAARAEAERLRKENERLTHEVEELREQAHEMSEQLHRANDPNGRTVCVACDANVYDGGMYCADCEEEGIPPAGTCVRCGDAAEGDGHLCDYCSRGVERSLEE